MQDCIKEATANHHARNQASLDALSEFEVLEKNLIDNLKEIISNLSTFKGIKSIKPIISTHMEDKESNSVPVDIAHSHSVYFGNMVATVNAINAEQELKLFQMQTVGIKEKLHESFPEFVSSYHTVVYMYIERNS